MTTDLRWPIQPLLDHPGVTATAISHATHLSGAKWAQALAEGLTDSQADRAAIRLGTLPHLIWPDWVTAGLTVLDHMWLETGWRQAWLWREAA